MLDLAPLYALDALEGPELAGFEAHLATCGECLSILDVYRGAAANLVHDATASEDTWAQISAAISDNDAGGVAMPAPSRRSDPWRWVAGLAAAAALLLAGVLVTQLTRGSQLTDRGIVASAARAADEPGAISGDFLVDDMTVAQVVLASDGRGFVIPTEDLATLDPARTYQLWVINDTEDVISAGVLGPDPEPATFTWAGAVSGFALTRESAGGVVSSAGDVVAVLTDF